MRDSTPLGKSRCCTAPLEVFYGQLKRVGLELPLAQVVHPGVEGLCQGAVVHECKRLRMQVGDPGYWITPGM